MNVAPQVVKYWLDFPNGLRPPLGGVGLLTSLACPTSPSPCQRTGPLSAEGAADHGAEFGGLPRLARGTVPAGVISEPDGIIRPPSIPS